MPPVRPPRRSSAFTLIELLTVMAILAILSGIVMGILSSSKQRANIARAKSDLALLVQALEEYKRYYGDYPQTGPSVANSQKVTGTVGPGTATTQARLFNALIGVYGPSNFSARQNGPIFVDVSKLTVEVAINSATFAVASGSPPAKTALSNSFVDPWGDRYMYFYKTATPPGGRPGTAWVPPAYVLYSTGPDGASSTLPGANGTFSTTGQTLNDNADNIYADNLP